MLPFWSGRYRTRPSLPSPTVSTVVWPIEAPKPGFDSRQTREARMKALPACDWIVISGVEKIQGRESVAWYPPAGAGSGQVVLSPSSTVQYHCAQHKTALTQDTEGGKCTLHGNFLPCCSLCLASGGRGCYCLRENPGSGQRFPPPPQRKGDVANILPGPYDKWRRKCPHVRVLKNCLDIGHCDNMYLHGMTDKINNSTCCVLRDR